MKNDELSFRYHFVLANGKISVSIDKSEVGLRFAELLVMEEDFELADFSKERILLYSPKINGYKHFEIIEQRIYELGKLAKMLDKKYSEKKQVRL